MSNTYSCDVEKYSGGKQVPASCLFSRLSSDSNGFIERSNIIKSLESGIPNFLTLGVRNDVVDFIQYSKTPFIDNNTEINNLTLFVYCVITIKSEDKYAFMSEYEQTSFYINGVFVSDGISAEYIILTPGDYIMCINFKVNDSSAFNNSLDIFIKKKTDVDIKSNISEYIEKPIDFLTKIEESKISADSAYCGPRNYLTSVYCKDIIKNGNNLNKSIFSKCFANGAFNSSEDCSNLIFKSINSNSSTDINNELIEIINEEVDKWFSSRLSSLETATSADLEKLNILFYSLKNLNKIINSLDINTQERIISYCEKNIGDRPLYKDDSTICGKLYSKTGYDNPGIYEKLGSSKENILKKYCLVEEGDVKRYEVTNSSLDDNNYCKSLMMTKSLQDELLTRCVNKDKWSIEDKFCNFLVDRNINKESGDITINKDILSNLIDYKNRYAVSETTNINDDNNRLLTEEYIVGNLYDYIQKSNTSSDKETGLENLLINDAFLNYCLEKDSYLSKSSCGRIYNKYGENQKIIKSRTAMRNKNCLSDDKLMSELETDLSINQNMNNCKSITTKTDLDSISIFGDKVSDYCSKDSNIISKDCKDYYNGVTNELVNNWNNSNISDSEIVSVDAMTNKENKTYGDMSYQILIIILILSGLTVIYSIVNGYNAYSINKKNKEARIALNSIGLR